MKAQKHQLLLLLMLFFSWGYAQKSKLKEAEKHYDKQAYIKTSDILLKVAEKGYESVDLFKKLGNSYYFNNQMTDAVKWYAALMDIDASVDPEYYYRYAYALKYLENYEESDVWMMKFNELNTQDFRAKAFVNKVNYLEAIEKASRDITIVNLPINSSFSDFGATQYENQLIFASSRNQRGKTYKWNGQPFLELYTATKTGTGLYDGARLFNNRLNTKYHESSASFTPNDLVIFFTRNNFFKGKSKRDDQGVNRLQLYRSQLNKEANKWSKETPVHFNSESYSVAHPSINVSGNTMYFASDMPGSKGLSDIFMVEIFEDGSLGTPVNLVELNTQGQESFPFVSENGDLYFSSNGFVGLGGMDVYKVKDFENRFKNNQPLVVSNIGKPVNSAQDDFAYTENLGTNEAFFSSNRPGGQGDDDIYSFIIPKCMQTVVGVVKNKKTKDHLPFSKVTLFSENRKVIQTITLGDDAAFSFSIDCDTSYLIRAEKETFISDEKLVTTPVRQDVLELELLLEPDEQPVNLGDDLAKLLDIPMIFFDFDKHHIRQDAILELEKLLVVLNQYPNMKLDIRSHTDCRANNSYNQSLSQRRATSTRDYLIEQGIAPNRLTAKGYGESQLVNHCDCDSKKSAKCSEAQHQRNRRSEFIIVDNLLKLE